MLPFVFLAAVVTWTVSPGLTAAELSDFQQGNNRLIGTKVTYSLPDGKTAGAVTLEVLSHPLEDADE